MTLSKPILLGTRGSLLALKQSELVARELERLHPGLAVELRIIKTRGDIVAETALGAIGDKGLFVREIEQALRTGAVDFAVHSMKDLPTGGPADLAIAAVPRREDPRDALVARGGLGLAQLPPGAVVGTGSLRRSAQLLARRPDLAIADIRGNVETRLRKLDEGRFDAIVLALAGLRRIGHEDRAAQLLDAEIMLPAPAQGALALQARSGDTATENCLRALHHGPTALAVAAERALLHELEGGCHAPIGALCACEQGQPVLRGCVLSPDGSRRIAAAVQVDPGAPENSGIGLARMLLDRGAAALLRGRLEEALHAQ